MTKCFYFILQPGLGSLTPPRRKQLGTPTPKEAVKVVLPCNPPRKTRAPEAVASANVSAPEKEVNKYPMFRRLPGSSSLVFAPTVEGELMGQKRFAQKVQTVLPYQEY